MISYASVQSELKSSQWDEQAQKDLGAVLPRLGQHTLHFLSNKIPGSGSEVLAAELVAIAEQQVRWYQSLTKGDTVVVQRQFYEAWNTASIPGELMLVNAVRDIRANGSINAAVTVELANAFNYLTCYFMGEVGAADVVQILSHGALQCAIFCNLSGEVKRYCYLKNIEDSQAREIQLFIRALENNSEQLGTVKLDLVGGAQPPLMKHWLTSFLEMGSKHADRSNFNVAYFMTNHPAAVKLLREQKEQLSDILRLYNWLHAPVIVPKEFETYELEREEYFEQAKMNVINLGLGLIKTAALSRLTPNAKPGATPEQIQTLDDITQRDSKGMRYNASESPFDKRYNGPRGLALGQKTNIAIDQEKMRLEQDRASQKASIEKKLQELRKRKQG